VTNPNTPRAAYEALEGKRPELLLTPTRGEISARFIQGEKLLGKFPAIIVIWGRAPGYNQAWLHSAN
jgi:hypothetical protein